MKNLHHIGIATNDIDKLTNEYLSCGYKLTKEVYDPIQKAKLRLLHKKNHENIELISTNDRESRVFNLTHNNYKKEYHKCYQVQNINDHINKLRKEGFILITNIEPSPLLDSKVCFMYKNNNVIELMEKI